MTSNGEFKFAYFLAGIGLGAIAGILFAPYSGEETREYIRKRADEGRDQVKRQAKEFSQRAEELVEKGKDFVGRKRESTGTAVDVARQAYEQEKLTTPG